MSRLPARCAAGLVRCYQLTLSPLKACLAGAHGCCRFYPSCSEYARQALLGHGLLRGSWLAAVRLLKCHPFHPGGVDPVPAPGGGAGLRRPGQSCRCASAGDSPS